MSNLDTNDSFIYIWKAWRFVGVYPFPKLKWLYNIYAILVNLAADIVSPFFIFVNVFFVNDPSVIMNNLKISPTLIVASIKQLVIFFRMSNFHMAKVYINQLDQRASLNKAETQYLRNVVKQCHCIALAEQIALFASLLSYVIPGLIGGRLIFAGWFPFDWTSSSTLYVVAFSYQYLSCAFQCVQNAANDSYPPIYINVLMGHIHVLCMRVSRIGRDSGATHDDNYKELKACIRDHKNIISLFETIKPVISESVMIQFFITALVLCLAAIHYLVFDRDISQLISTIVYIACILSGSFPVCYFGNALMVESESLTTAIYSCNWVDQTIKFRKSLIIFMQRSQKTDMILAGGLIPISLQTFTEIIRFSFSMFTVLSQV